MRQRRLWPVNYRKVRGLEQVQECLALHALTQVDWVGPK